MLISKEQSVSQQGKATLRGRLGMEPTVETLWWRDAFEHIHLKVSEKVKEEHSELPTALRKEPPPAGRQPAPYLCLNLQRDKEMERLR